MPSSTPTRPSPTASTWPARADNIVVTHTFSKLHGLAALRVGWAYAPAPVADAVDRIRLPFNTSIAGQAAAVAALADDEFQAPLAGPRGAAGGRG